MGNLFLLDTNGVSDLLRDRSPALRLQWSETRRTGHQVVISALTHAELLFGFLQNPGPHKLRSAYDDFLAGTNVLAWTEQASASYALLRLHLKTSQLVVDVIDLLLASHAYALGATLVTRDKGFRHVSSLVQVVNWATDLK